MPEFTKIEISTASIFKSILVILLIIFLYVLQDVVIIFLFALVIAAAISPFANWLDQRRFPRLLGVLLLYLTVFSIFAFVFSLIIPYVSEEIGQLNQTLPKIVEKISSSLENV